MCRLGPGWEMGSERRKLEAVPREEGMKARGSQEELWSGGGVLGHGVGTWGSLRVWRFLRGSGFRG